MTAPAYVAVRGGSFDVNEFDPGPGLPAITQIPQLISVQGTLNAVLLAAAKAGVELRFFATGTGGTTPLQWPFVHTVNGVAADTTGNVTVAGGGGGSTLTPTPTKNAAYTAAAGDLVTVDATSAPVTITLPNAPADKTQILVKKIDGTAATPNNPVTVARSGTDVFNKTGGSTTLTLTRPLQDVLVQYQSSTGLWLVLAVDPALAVGTTAGTVAAGDDSRFSAGAATLTATTVKTAAYTAAAGQSVPADATSAAFTVTLPAAPADKTQVLVKKVDTSGNAVTVACGGSDVLNRASGPTSTGLYFTGQAVWLQYETTRALWTILADDIPTAIATTFPRFQRWDGVTGGQPGRLVTAPGQMVIWIQPSPPAGGGTVNGGAGMVDGLDLYIAG